MQKTVLILILGIIFNFGYSQNTIECIESKLSFHTEEKLDKCSKLEMCETLECLNLFDELDDIKDCLSFHHLRGLTNGDFEKIRKIYTDIDNDYTDFWIQDFQGVRTKKMTHHWTSFYFKFEEAIRYSNLKFSNKKPDFNFLKKRMQGITNKDSIEINAYLSEAFNKRVFNDSGIYYIKSVGAYKAFIIHNINLYQKNIAQEIQEFQPILAKREDYIMFNRWQTILWKSGNNELLKSLLLEKKDAFEKAGRQKAWKGLMERN